MEISRERQDRPRWADVYGKFKGGNTHSYNSFTNVILALSPSGREHEDNMEPRKLNYSTPILYVFCVKIVLQQRVPNIDG